jgi:hypothetical protein
MHSWSTFGAQTSHGQTRTHKTHHSPNLGKTITFPFIVFFVFGHRANTQMSFCLGIPKYWKQLENKQEMKDSRFMKWHNV